MKVFKLVPSDNRLIWIECFADGSITEISWSAVLFWFIRSLAEHARKWL
jgi:hypothetical protein